MSTIVDFDNLAAAQVGVPYVFGGTSLKNAPHPGLDCSGFPYAVSLALGVSIPRTSEAQFAGLTRIGAPERRGDLVFYNVPTDTQAQPAHMAIWWDASTVLQAPRTGEDVMFCAPLPYQVMGYRRLPFPDATPPPATPRENNMIARDNGTNGYWVARSNGNTYAFDGAPYLGPLPKYTAQWGIGTAANPIVGIVSDNAGGFTLAADNGGAEPSIYHITSDGAYAK